MARPVIDLTGQSFGMLTVIGLAQERKRVGKTTVRLWDCVCRCGNHTKKSASELKMPKDPKNPNCGCIMSGKDITGLRFGRLTALHSTGVRKGSGIVWVCQCDCGKMVELGIEHLTSGNTKSCGCLAKDVQREHVKALLQRQSWVADTSIQRIRSDKLFKNNTTGYKGVTQCRSRDNRFEATIGFQKKAYYLGRFDTAQEAAAVRKKAEDLLHAGSVSFYDKWKAKAEQDPAWAKANPVRIHVERIGKDNFSVSFLPEI